MLAYLRGQVRAKTMTTGPVDRLVLEVAGVGFELSVARRTLVTVGELGDEATVHTALCIRENEWTLFGFASIAEREMFGLLQSVTGIGPRLALALVGTLPPMDLAEAILAEDHKLISQAPGVGTKVAQRIILELKGKIEEFRASHGMQQPVMSTNRTGTFEEVRMILEGLGYTTVEIGIALKKAEEDQLQHDVELLVRHSLKTLGSVGR
jgi:Holliday junction DNA helicase RuvA